MSNKEKVLPVPARRFPDFRGAKGWVKARLIDTADRSVKWSFIGGPFGSNLKSSDYVRDGVRIIQLQNIGDGEFFDDYRIFTTVEKADELRSNNIYPGEIIMSKMGDPVGRACLIPNLHDRYVMCSDGIRLVVDEKAHNKYFVYSLINSPLFRSAVEKTATGSTRKRIGLDELKNLPMRLPSKAEQKKIADCLSSLNQLIAAQALKVDALKTHKKGLMQQLFPREGETQPRLRFPEFQNFSEWGEVALGEIAEIKLGKMLDKQKHTTGHLLPYLNNISVRWNEVNTSDLPQMYFDERELERFGLKAGDVVVCEGGEPGRAAVWDGRLPDLKFQKAIHRVRFNVPFEPKLLVLHLENLSGTTQFEMLFTGGGIKHLTGETFSKLKIPLIPYVEQQRIADCLNSLDDLITAAAQEFDALKTHKKGLVQQLFPSAKAVEA